jgi:hypothetical protein
MVRKHKKHKQRVLSNGTCVRLVMGKRVVRVMCVTKLGRELVIRLSRKTWRDDLRAMFEMAFKDTAKDTLLLG